MAAPHSCRYSSDLRSKRTNMHACCLPSPLSRLAMLLRGVVLIVLSTIFVSARANEPIIAAETALSTALLSPNSREIVFTVHPMVGRPNQPRTIFLQQFVPGCPGVDLSVDTSSMDSTGLVAIRAKRRTGIICPSVPMSPVYARFEFEFTPTKEGALTIHSDAGGLDFTIQTVSDAMASKFDVNGMWFDTSTNGSGIALHHSRGKSDVAFGTWFLFSNTTGAPRWYTLQTTYWAQDGSALEGLLYTVNGLCVTPNLAGCPGAGSVRSDFPRYLLWEAPSRARITFQSSVRARAEVLSLGGTVLFTSELTKLLF